MSKLTPKQQYLLDALQPGVPAIVATSQYAEIVNNSEGLPVIYGGTAAAVKGLAERGLVEYKQFWRCAVVTKK